MRMHVPLSLKKYRGFGGSGLIPQTLLNLQSGGTTKLSAVSYALAMAVLVVAGKVECTSPPPFLLLLMSERLVRQLVSVS